MENYQQETIKPAHKIFLRYLEAKNVSCQLIGLNYSATVEAIIEEVVDYDQVVKIIAGTAIRNKTDLERWIMDCQRIVWKKDPKRAADIARKFWQEEKVEQPRLENLARIPMFCEGAWVTIGNEDKVIYEEYKTNKISLSKIMIYGFYNFWKNIV